VDNTVDVVQMLTVIFGGSIVAIVIIGAIFLLAIRILKGSSGRGGEGTSSDEARVIQEIYQGLSRMEERVEALETILLDQDRKERSK
jgi:phage shock protein B